MTFNEQEVQPTRAAIRQGAVFNAAYGLVAGLAFALAMWGRDAILLSNAHAFLPWVKLILGALMCALVGAITGWLASRRDNGCLGVFIWLGGALGMAAVTVVLPLSLMPALSEAVEPGLTGLLHYSTGNEYVVRFWIAFAWAGVFMSITGILQTTLVESAMAGLSTLGRLLPFSLSVILMAIGGVLLDDLINTPFRNAIYALDVPIHFILDSNGSAIDPEDARKYRTSALRIVEDDITAEHHLIVSEYDESFGRINVVIRFGDTWVECTTVYQQATFCEYAERGD